MNQSIFVHDVGDKEDSFADAGCFFQSLQAVFKGVKVIHRSEKDDGIKFLVLKHVQISGVRFNDPDLLVLGPQHADIGSDQLDGCHIIAFLFQKKRILARSGADVGNAVTRL